MNEDLQCPIDYVKVNENKVRMIAFLVLILSVFFLFTGYKLVIALLIFDFAARTFNKQNYSLLGWLADKLITQFKIPYKPTDRGPKRFAAGMGLVFVLLISVAAMNRWEIVLMPLVAVLCIFAFLESFSGFCVGCYVYTGMHWVARKLGKA